MSVRRTITGGHKAGPKDSRSVEFSTTSEALALIQDGKVPQPFESFRQLYLFAVAHMDVTIQKDIRDALDGPAVKGSRKSELDD